MSRRDGYCRFVLSGGFILLSMLGLGSRLAFLHLGPDEGVSRRFEEKLHAGRGSIFDRRGVDNILALSLSAQEVWVKPWVVVSNDCVARVASELADILDLPADQVAVRCNKPGDPYEPIKRPVFVGNADRIRKLNLPGVHLKDMLARVYPHGSFMCHVLGFVNDEGAAGAGVEQAMDSFLRGCPGLLESRLNARRQELYVWRGRYIPALEGSDVYLTLDQNIQYALERTMDNAVREHHAKGAWAIVQKVRTGEILAMCSRPAFNLNAFGRATTPELLNRAIGHVYEPGSTFKTAVIAAALNEGVVATNTALHCEDGEWPYGNRVLHDFHPYGELTVADGLKKSSNILAAKVALRLPRQTFYDYLRAFGIGRAAGIDLPGEEHGILPHVAKWSNLRVTRIAIGQGVAVTALQMLGVISAIANDGFLMRPYVVKEVRSKDGRIRFRNVPSVMGRPISCQTAATMRVLLRRATEEGGTGRRACVSGYSVAGKTGTAQKPFQGGYSDTNYMASFVGFVPADDPRIAIIVVVDDPQPLHVGGLVAAPVFSAVAGETMRYLDISPSVDRMVSL